MLLKSVVLIKCDCFRNIPARSETSAFSDGFKKNDGRCEMQVFEYFITSLPS